jgi:hypothetical protein
MNRVVRAFLVWAMVITMPVQGMAASVMLFCGPSHERMMQELMVDGPTVGSSQVAEAWHEDSAADHGLHERAAPVRAGADNSGAGSDADGLTSLFPHNGKFSCSACAACCVPRWRCRPASCCRLPSSPEYLVPMSHGRAGRIAPA